MCHGDVRIRACVSVQDCVCMCWFQDKRKHIILSWAATWSAVPGLENQLGYGLKDYLLMLLAIAIGHVTSLSS